MKCSIHVGNMSIVIVLIGIFISSVVLFLFLIARFIRQRGYLLTYRCYDGKNVLIILYHDICQGIDEVSSKYTITYSQFYKHMAYLNKKGYNPISIYQFHEYVRRGIDPPEKPVLLTFDGPYRSWVTTIVPTLIDFGFKAVFFVVTDWINNETDRRNATSWEELRQLRKYKLRGERLFNIESHTVQHSILVKGARETDSQFLKRVYFEIAESKKALESHLGDDVRFLATPKGLADPEIIPRIVKECGYWGIRSCDMSFPNDQNIDEFHIGLDFAGKINLKQKDFEYSINRFQISILGHFRRWFFSKAHTLWRKLFATF